MNNQLKNDEIMNIKMKKNQGTNEEIDPNDPMTKLGIVTWKIISSFWFPHWSFQNCWAHKSWLKKAGDNGF